MTGVCTQTHFESPSSHRRKLLLWAKRPSSFRCLTSGSGNICGGLHLESLVIFVDLSTYGPHRKWVMMCFMSYRNVPILGVDSRKKHGRLDHGAVNLGATRCIWWSLVAKDICRMLKITLYNQGVGCYCGHLWSWFLMFFQYWWLKLPVYYWYTIYIGFSLATFWWCHALHSRQLDL